MADYKGNFHSQAYADSSTMEKAEISQLFGVVKSHTVTAGEVTATKVLLDNNGVAGVSTTAVLAIVYRAGVALPTNFTLETTTTNGVISTFLKGNGGYTLTAGDVIVYIAEQIIA